MSDWTVPPILQAQRDQERMKILIEERAKLAASGKVDPALEKEIGLASGKPGQIQWDSPEIPHDKVKWDQPAPAPKGLSELPADMVPGVGQSILIGAGRTFDRVGKGFQQLYYGATGDAAAQEKLKQQASSDDAAYRMLQDKRPIATGFGEALPSMAIPAGGGATTLATAGRLALAGGIPGMLEYGTTGERLAKGAVGAAAGVTVPVAASLLKSGKALVEPLYQAGREKIVGRALNRVAGDSADAVRQRLMSAAELVPGSAPTAAEVAQSGGIAALQRAAAQANPEAYAQRGMEQSSARLSALRGIAGDDSAMAAARSARDSASESLYASSMSQGVQRTPELDALLSRPIMQRAKQKAAELAANNGEKFSLEAPKAATDAIVDSMGLPLRSGAPATPGTYSVQGLHYLKLALDDIGSGEAKTALGRNEMRALGENRSALLDILDNAVPDYAAARSAFAQGSKPINQMKIGQGLLNSLEPALANHGALARETGAKYANALRNGDQMAKSLTGSRGGIESVMSPDQMNTLNAVAQDLARKANAQDLGRGVGSNTFQNLAMDNIAAQSGLPRAVGGLLNLPGINRATSWIYSTTDDKMKGLLSDALLDPNMTASLMTKAEKKLLKNSPKARALLEQSIMRAGLLAAPAAYGVAE